ncbi:putative serine/threonine-protein kinase pats1 [Saccoglossus kowalevskii]
MSVLLNDLHPNLLQFYHSIGFRVYKYAIENRKLLQQNLHRALTFSISDFAGDDIFYDTHHVFIASESIFLVVFNLAKFEQNDQRTFELNRILFWLHSIHAHAKYRDLRIFLVGTHRDSVDKKTIEDIAIFLKRKLCHMESAYAQRLVINEDNTPLFRVENSRHGDVDLHHLQSVIIKEANEIGVMKKKFPIRWLRFLDMLMVDEGNQHPAVHLVDTGRRKEFIMPLKKAIRFALRRNVVKDQEEMMEMLHYFNRTGDLIYVQNDIALRQYVILNPELLVDAVKTITNVPERKYWSPINVRFWGRLAEEGIIHIRLLKKLMRPLPANIDAIINLLQCYDLIVPVGSISKSAVGMMAQEYMVPLMRPTYKDLPENLGPAPPARVVYFVFGFFRPDCIFTRLMAKCIPISHSFKVFRNVGRFNVDEQYACRVELFLHIPEQQMIKVTVVAVEGANPYTLIRRLCNYIEAIVCRDVPELKYTYGVPCTSPGDIHDGCSNGELHILQLTSRGKRFPALGSTITRHCNGVQQNILIDNVIRDGEVQATKLDILHMHTTKMKRQWEDEAHEELLYDVYVICGKRDHAWVQDKLSPMIEKGPSLLVLKVNCFDTDRDLPYLKSSPVNIAVISRHSVNDPRCQDEMDLAYAHHGNDNVIHILIDDHASVQKLKETLKPPHQWIDYTSYRNKHRFYEDLLDIIQDIYDPPEIQKE